MAVGGGWGGYKMSISSNNAIDKQRQLKQAEVAEEQQKKQAGGGGVGVAGCPARRVASLCVAMRPFHVA